MLSPQTDVERKLTFRHRTQVEPESLLSQLLLQSGTKQYVIMFIPQS